MSGMKLDILQRDEITNQVCKIIETIAAKKGNISFSIDGEWGSGKTFVLDMVEKRLKSQSDRYMVMRYNCWKYDYYEEPIVAICSVIAQTIKHAKDALPDEKKKILVDAFHLIVRFLGKVVETKTGLNPAEIAKDALDDAEKTMNVFQEFDSYLTLKEQIDIIRDALEKMAEKRTVIVMVDELDRCMPEYAIKVLERLHHLFVDIPNIQIVLAIDRKQIEYTIKQMFGDNANIEKYLQKFISFGIKLDKGNISKKIEEKYQDYISKFEIKEEFFNSYGKDFLKTMFSNIEVRKMEELMHTVEIAHDALFNRMMGIEMLCFEVIYAVFNGYYKVDMREIPFIQFMRDGQICIMGARENLTSKGEGYKSWAMVPEGIIERNPQRVLDGIFYYFRANWNLRKEFGYNGLILSNIGCRELVAFAFDSLRRKPLENDPSYIINVSSTRYLSNADMQKIQSIQRNALEFADLYDLVSGTQFQNM